MLGCRQSGLAENYFLIKMNDQLSAKLKDMGRRMNAILDGIQSRIPGGACESKEDDRVYGAGR